MTNVFFHIGLHKTATTTLQSQYFPVCKNLNYITKTNNDINKFVDRVAIIDPIYFDSNKARNLIIPHLHNDKPNLISRESLSGSLYDGIIKYGLDHRSSIIANLKNAIPEAKLIIVIRRQDSLSRSIYRQYLKSGGTESIYKFYHQKNNNSSLFSLDRFKFNPYINLLSESFPAGVLVLTFEEFIKNQTQFLQKLSHFIGVSPLEINLKKSNQSSLGSFGMGFSRLINHFFYSRLNPGGILKGVPKCYRNKKIIWSSPSGVLHDRWPIKRLINKDSAYYKVSKSILELVKEDNKMIDKNYNLNLEKYGYF